MFIRFFLCNCCLFFCVVWGDFNVIKLFAALAYCAQHKPKGKLTGRAGKCAGRCAGRCASKCTRFFCNLGIFFVNLVRYSFYVAKKWINLFKGGQVGGG